MVKYRKRKCLSSLTVKIALVAVDTILLMVSKLSPR